MEDDTRSGEGTPLLLLKAFLVELRPSVLHFCPRWKFTPNLALPASLSGQSDGVGINRLYQPKPAAGFRGALPSNANSVRLTGQAGSEG